MTLILTPEHAAIELHMIAPTLHQYLSIKLIWAVCFKRPSHGRLKGELQKTRDFIAAVPETHLLFFLNSPKVFGWHVISRSSTKPH